MSYLRFAVVIAVFSGIALLVSTQADTLLVRQPVPAHADSKRHYGHVDTVSREELDMTLAEIDRLRREVAVLSRQVSQLQNQEQLQSSYSPEPSSMEDNYYREEINYSVADRFEYGDQSSQSGNFDDSNLEGVIYASVSPDVEVYSTECRGALCKVYTSSLLDETYDTVAGDEFVENITNSMDGNVNIYFDEEGGQQVIYVESVE
ncbi:hypothetical protein ACFL3Y_01015 [Pseudomonadota bacterium]